MFDIPMRIYVLKCGAITNPPYKIKFSCHSGSGAIITCMIPNGWTIAVQYYKQIFICEVSCDGRNARYAVTPVDRQGNRTHEPVFESSPSKAAACVSRTMHTQVRLFGLLNSEAQAFIREYCPYEL
jgi:hypothetical protein